MSTRVIHRFLRQPNLNSSVTNRPGNRYDPFQNTLSVLKDPKNSRELYLIGTTNSSTTLAYRTKKLIQQVKPSSVYVQASQKWWSQARHTTVENQADFSGVSSSFQCDNYTFENNLRGILWRLRYYSWCTMMKGVASFPNDFNPFTPGLETKFAIEEAQKLGAEPIFGGVQYDPITLEALRTETDMYAHTAMWRARNLIKSQSAWSNEYSDFMKTLKTRGGEAFAESMDRSRSNFLVQLLQKVAPVQKKVLIDHRDERIFRDLYKNCHGERIVAVINQWHMQGVESHWRTVTGTEITKQKLSPVADMDIDEYQERHLINEFLRDYTSKKSKSEPATHQDMIVNYHKQNFEYERTRHTHHESHEDIPNPGEQHKKVHH